MTLDELYAALNEYGSKPTATVHGSTWLKDANMCGLKAYAREKQGPPKAVTWPRPPGTPVIGWRAGVTFHGLRFLGLESQASALRSAVDTPDCDPDVKAAVNAFAREAMNPFDRQLGQPVQAEQALELVTSAFGFVDSRFTGRPDRVVEIDHTHIRAFAAYSLIGLEPGHYLWDYKLLASISAKDADFYRYELQQLYYAYLYWSCTNVRPKGVIYDLVSRAAKPTIGRLLVYEPFTDAHVEMVETVMARAANAEPRANAQYCSDADYGPCRFLGVCRRAGTWESNPILQNWVSNPDGAASASAVSTENTEK